MSCGCGSSGGCSCNAEFIVNPSIIGPPGPPGPTGGNGTNGTNGTTVLYWNNSTLSTAVISADVLVATYNLPANSLVTDGDEVEIIITGVFSGNATRLLKIELNNPIYTVVNNSGVVVNGNFLTTYTITRTSNTTTTMHVTTIYNLGGAMQMIIPPVSYVTDFTINQDINFYINNSAANKLTINSIKIKKSII